MADAFPLGSKVSFLVEGGNTKQGIVQAIRIVDGNQTYAVIKVDGEPPGTTRNVSTLALTRVG